VPGGLVDGFPAGVPLGRIDRRGTPASARRLRPGGRQRIETDRGDSLECGTAVDRQSDRAQVVNKDASWSGWAISTAAAGHGDLTGALSRGLDPRHSERASARDGGPRRRRQLAKRLWPLRHRGDRLRRRAGRRGDRQTAGTLAERQARDASEIYSRPDRDEAIRPDRSHRWRHPGGIVKCAWRVCRSASATPSGTRSSMGESPRR
jgi:hypothetical protein